MKNFIISNQSVLKLIKKKYADAYSWFWNQANERGDNQLRNDIANGRLNTLAEKSIKDFLSGNFKEL